jgi:hypothetical protein
MDVPRRLALARHRRLPGVPDVEVARRLLVRVRRLAADDQRRRGDAREPENTNVALHCFPFALAAMILRSASLAASVQ